MTRDDIIRMAREAGMGVTDDDRYIPVWHLDIEHLERFSALVAAAEREACADICDTTPPHPFRPSIEAAHAIRARSKE